MRAIDGPLAEVHGLRPEMTTYQGAAQHLQEVWIATRASLRAVLETTSLDHITKGQLPRAVAKLVANPDSWQPRVR